MRRRGRARARRGSRPARSGRMPRSLTPQPRPSSSAMQHEAVGIVDRARRQRVAGLARARRRSRRARRGAGGRPASSARPSDAASPISCGRSRWPGVEHGRARARRPRRRWRRLAPRLMPGGHGDARRRSRAILLHQHGVGPSGIGAPVKMRIAAPRAPRGRADGRPRRGPSTGSTVGASAREIVEAHGIAVDRGIVVRRHVAGRDESARRGCGPRRVAERDGLDLGHRLTVAAQDAVERLRAPTSDRRRRRSNRR